MEMLLEEEKKRKFLSKAKNGIPIVTEVTVGDIHLTQSELDYILKEHFTKENKNNLKHFSDEINEALGNALKNQVMQVGLHIVEKSSLEIGKKIDIIDRESYYPFVDKHLGIVFAKPMHILVPIYDSFEANQRVSLENGTNCFLNQRRTVSNERRHPINFSDNSNCFCGSNIVFRECCKKLVKQMDKKLKEYPCDFSNLHNFLKKPLLLNEELEFIIGEILFRICVIKKSIEKSNKFLTKSDRAKKELIKEIISEINLFILNYYFSYKENNLAILINYYNLLEYTINPSNSNFVAVRKRNKLFKENLKLLEQYDTTLNNSPGLNPLSIERVKSLNMFEESTLGMDITDFSPLTIGYISMLEKELNDVRKLIEGKDNIKPLMLKNLFAYFKKITDYNVMDKILPLIYTLRFIRDEELDNLIKNVRNRVVHGEVSQDTYSEYKLIKGLCECIQYNGMGLFGAISLAKLSLKNQVIVDKEKITHIFIEKLKQEFN